MEDVSFISALEKLVGIFRNCYLNTRVKPLNILCHLAFCCICVVPHSALHFGCKPSHAYSKELPLIMLNYKVLSASIKDKTGLSPKCLIKNVIINQTIQAGLNS